MRPARESDSDGSKRTCEEPVSRNCPGARLRSICRFRAVKREGTRCTSSRITRPDSPPTNPAGSALAAARATSSSKLM